MNAMTGNINADYPQIVTEICAELTTLTQGRIEIGEDTDLLGDLNLDSLQVMNFMLQIEDRFDISIDPPTGPGTGFRSVITTGNPAKSFNLSGGRVLIATPGPDPVNGDIHFQIEIHPPSGIMTPMVRKMMVVYVALRVNPT